MATTPTRRHFLQSAAGGVLAAATMPTTGLGSAPRFDVVIRGGTIVDGTGSRGSRNDLGIRGDRVAAIGNLADADTKRSVNATGRIVCPNYHKKLGNFCRQGLYINRFFASLDEYNITRSEGFAPTQRH